MAIVPKLICISNVITNKIPTDFAEIIKLALKFIRKCKGYMIAKTILKKDKLGGLTLRNPDYCTAKLQ